MPKKEKTSIAFAVHFTLELPSTMTVKESNDAVKQVYDKLEALDVRAMKIGWEILNKPGNGLKYG